MASVAYTAVYAVRRKASRLRGREPGKRLTTYRGRCFTSSKMCAMYSPMTANTATSTSSRIRYISTIQAQAATTNTPRGASTLGLRFPNTIDANETTNPTFNPRRSGRLKNPISASPARRNIRRRLAGSGCSRRRRVRDTRLAETDPAEHPTEVPIRLPHGAKRIERGGSIDEAEVAGRGRHVDIRQSTESAIERSRRPVLESTLRLDAPPSRRR